jgi:hypothetical protein
MDRVMEFLPVVLPAKAVAAVRALARELTDKAYDLLLLVDGVDADYREPTDWVSLAYDPAMQQVIFHAGSVSGAIRDFGRVFPIVHAIEWHRENHRQRPQLPVRVLVLTDREGAGDTALGAALLWCIAHGYEVIWQHVPAKSNPWNEWTAWMASQYGNYMSSWFVDVVNALELGIWTDEAPWALGVWIDELPWAQAKNVPDEASVAGDGAASH